MQQDASWNASALIDPTGNVQERYAFDPFGQATILTPTWSTRAFSSFAWVYLNEGGRLDSVTALYSLRRRDYSPTLGRWVEQDPAGYVGGRDPNLYRDVSNDPIAFTDPSGLDKKPVARPLTPPANSQTAPKPGANSYQSVQQGSIKDCWLAASIASLAHQRPEDIANMIVPLPDGSYDVYLPGHSKPVNVNPLANGMSSDSGNYAGILEAAVNDALGGLGSRGPSMGIGIQLLTGNGVTFDWHLFGSFPQDNFLHFLDSVDNKKCAILGTGLFNPSMDGILPAHCYSYIGWQMVNGQVQYILRNPHGFKGCTVPDGRGLPGKPGEFWLTMPEIEKNFMGIAFEK